VAGDQQAATIGQGCFSRHDESDLRHRLLRLAQYRRRASRLQEQALTTIAYQLGGKAQLCARRRDLHSPARRCNGCATRSR
jgi:glycerol kinase